MQEQDTTTGSHVQIVKPCGYCGAEFHPTPSALKYSSFECKSCRRERSLKWRRSQGSRERCKIRWSSFTVYNSWIAMIHRCRDPKNSAYKYYGGRGITVCERWADSFQTFLSDMGSPPTPSHQIDRVDNDKGCEPGNCRWTTRKQQCRNRRSNHILTANGQSKTLAEWVEQTGISRGALWSRISRGWKPDDAVNTPVRCCRKGRTNGRS